MDPDTTGTDTGLPVEPAAETPEVEAPAAPEAPVEETPAAPAAE